MTYKSGGKVHGKRTGKTPVKKGGKAMKKFKSKLKHVDEKGRNRRGESWGQRGISEE